MYIYTSGSKCGIRIPRGPLVQVQIFTLVINCVYIHTYHTYIYIVLVDIDSWFILKYVSREYVLGKYAGLHPRPPES